MKQSGGENVDREDRVDCEFLVVSAEGNESDAVVRGEIRYTGGITTFLNGSTPSAEALMAETPDVNQMYNEAVALKDEGDLDGAVARLRAILQVDADHVLTHSALAVYLHKQGQFEEAVAHAERVTQLAPDDPFSFTQLSVINQRCGRIPEAEDAMARARELQAGQ